MPAPQRPFPRITKSELLRATQPGALAAELNAVLYCSMTELEWLKLRWDKAMLARSPEAILLDIRDYLERVAHEEVATALGKEAL